jgi:hypothetical protein
MMKYYSTYQKKNDEILLMQTKSFQVDIYGSPVKSLGNVNVYQFRGKFIFFIRCCSYSALRSNSACA